MKWISAQEVIAFHDLILRYLVGVAGIPDAGIADSIIFGVLNRALYECINNIFELAATYWVAIARGHIFNDGNKRTSFFVTMAFLRRNGVLVLDEGTELEELTVQAATGEKTVEQLSAILRTLAIQS